MVPISNWNTLQLRSLIKDISKLYKIPFQDVNKVTSKMGWRSYWTSKKRSRHKDGRFMLQLLMR